MTDKIALRRTFNSNAALYHSMRPRYPELLFDTLSAETQLSDDARLLEIGSGTGQATESLAKRNYEITAVELGANLAELGRKALKNYPNVHIITSSFEEIELESESYDLIYSATAFHWIKPEFQFRKPHRLLKNGGHLAIIGTTHVSDEVGDKFFIAANPIYAKFQRGGAYKEDFHPEPLSELKINKIDESLFTPTFFKAFPLQVEYSAEEYIQLISTYSPTIAMDADERSDFLEAIRQLIEDQFGGSILKHYGFSLTIAKKKSVSSENA